MPGLEKSLKIISPSQGQHAQFIASEMENISLGFDTATATFDRSENDLKITLEDGGQVTLTDFFVTNGHELPLLTLADGQQIAAADFLKNSNIDVTTAAGPAVATTSGGTNYEDASGNLISGVERLGSLSAEEGTGPESFIASTRIEGVDVSLLGDAAADADADADVDADSDIYYSARAVLYTKGGGQALSLTGVAATNCEWADEKYADYFDLTVDNAGLVTISLKPGVTLPEGGANLYGYLTVTTTEGSYTVQVVVNQNDSFTSPTEDNNEATNGYTLAEGGLVHGEWHQGQGFFAGTDNTLHASGLGDHVTFTGGMTTTGNNNSIFTNTTTGNQASVNIGSQSTLEGMSARNGGANLIDGGTNGGTTDVTVTGGSKGMSAANGGSNTITNVQNVTVVSSGLGNLHASGANSINTISNVEGTVKVTGGVKALWAEKGGANLIDKADSVEITGREYGLYASGTNSTNTISNTEGAVKLIHTDSNYLAALAAHAGGKNLVDKAGSVEITGGLAGLMAFDESSINTISNVEGAVKITAKSYALSAMTGGKNLIDTVGSVELNRSFANLYASGTNSTNTISNIKGAVKGTSDFYNLNAGDGGKNLIDKAGSVEFNSNHSVLNAVSAGSTNTISNVEGTVKGTGHNYSLFAQDGGKNLIDKAGSVEAIAGAVGLYADGADSTNTISNIKGAVTVRATTGNAQGLRANSGGANLIDKAGSVEVTGALHGLLAVGAGSTNTISNIEGAVTITGTGAGTNRYPSYGLSAEKGGKNLIVTASSVEVTGKNSGLYASGAGSSNTISNVMGNVKIAGDERGMYAYEGGTNSIKNAEDVALSGKKSGMHAEKAGHNEISNVGKVTVQAGSVGDAMGAAGAGSVNSISHADEVNLAGTWSMSATAGGKNEISNVAGNVTLTSGIAGWAMNASDANSVNSISTAGAVTIGGGYHAMQAYNGGRNEISDIANAVELSGSNVGMIAIKANAVNTIKNVGSVSINAAYGISANEEARNEISHVAGNVTVAGTSNGITAAAEGSNKISNVDGAVTIIATSYKGLSAESGGKNVIDQVGSVDVNSGRDGLSSDGANSSNTISNVMDSVKITSGALGMYAHASGTNSIHNAGEVLITSGSVGIFAEAAGNNIISDIAGKVTITSQNSTGVYANGKDAQNSITNVGELQINGYGYGLYANAGGHNEITDVHGKVSITNVAAANNKSVLYANGKDALGNASVNSITKAEDVEINGTAAVMHASTGGQNKIDNVTGTVSLSSKNSFAMYATDSGTNSITNAGEVVITSKDSALYANTNGTNSIMNVGNVSISSLGTALYAYGAAKNTISDVDGKVTITSPNNAAFFAGNKGALNSISNVGELEVSSDTYVMSAAFGGRNEITDVHGKVSITNAATDGRFATLRAVGKDTEGNASVNSITKANEVEIKGTSYAIYASAGGQNKIDDIAGKITVTSASVGLYAYEGTNSISNANEVAITSKSIALSADVDGKNTISDIAGKVTLTSQGSTGMYASAKGALNSISNVGALEISGNGYGVHANAGGRNEIADVHGKVSITNAATGQNYSALYATSKDKAGNASTNSITRADEVELNGVSYGMYASSSGKNEISDITGKVTVTSAKDTALHATGSGSVNSINNAGEVEINGKLNALHAEKEGRNEISDTSKVTLTGGLKAILGGVNSIEAGNAEGIEVRITVAPGAGAAATAMYANGDGSINRIVGSADGHDYISIKGDIFAANGGQNIIQTSGTGKNLIELDGTVSKGGLTLETHGDYDVLVLKAGSVAEFTARFANWLKNIGDLFDIAKVEVLLGDHPLGGADLAALGLDWLVNMFGADKVHSLSQSEYAEQYSSAEAFASSAPHTTQAPSSAGETAHTAAVATGATLDSLAPHAATGAVDHSTNSAAAATSAEAPHAAHGEQADFVLDENALSAAGNIYVEDSNHMLDIAQVGTSLMETINAHDSAVALGLEEQQPLQDDQVQAVAMRDANEANQITALPETAHDEILSDNGLDTAVVLPGSDQDSLGLQPTENGTLPDPEGLSNAPSSSAQVTSTPDSTEGLANFENLNGQGDLWLNLEGGQNDTLNLDSLEHALKSLGSGNGLYILGASAESLDPDFIEHTGWQPTGEQTIVMGNQDTAVVFNVYKSDDAAEEQAMLYIQTSMASC